MTIQMVRSDNYSCPEIICDVCHRPIKDLAMGMVIWIDPNGWDIPHAGDTAPAYVIHKGECDRSTFKRLGVEVHAPWEELTEVIRQFGEHKSVKDRVQMLKEIGPVEWG